MNTDKKKDFVSENEPVVAPQELKLKLAESEQESSPPEERKSNSDPCDQLPEPTAQGSVNPAANNSDNQTRTRTAIHSRWQLSQADQQAQEIILEYRPFASTQNWFKNRFTAFSPWKVWFSMTLVVLFFAFGGPILLLEGITHSIPNITPYYTSTSTGVEASQENSAHLFELFVAFICLALGAGAFELLKHPTHIALRKRGLSLQWCRGNSIDEEELLWEQIERIGVSWPNRKTSTQDCLITFKPKRDGVSQPLNPIVIKLGALTKEAEREKLLRSIETWAPETDRDAELLELLSPPQNNSYTELWLQALSAPPKRERLTPLSEGTPLHSKRYEVRNQLGVGGQGTAYLAIDHELHTEVVLKEFILPVYVDAQVRRQAVERMQNEAAMLEKLDNERIVRLWDFFIEDHRGYLVLERIDGESLQQIVEREGRLAPSTVHELALQMCDILCYLHELKPPVVHRDFTPDNLILNTNRTLKLVDFNVAQQIEGTATGTVVGKHAYISPEQFRGRPAPQSDIYSMGATMFYLLTGATPEPIKQSHPQKLRPEISDAMDAVVARATAFDIKLRYENIEYVRQDLIRLDVTEMS